MVLFKFWSRITSYNVCYTKLLRIVFRSKDYPLVLRYGSVDDPDVAAPITGQSIALFGGGYALDNLPSIGQRNDIEGAYGIIKGSINIEKTHNTIGLGCSEITNERWEYQNVALIVVITSYSIHYTKLYDIAINAIVNFFISKCFRKLRIK